VDTDIAHDLLRQVTVGQLVTATQTGPGVLCLLVT
jgi:hypothetical protein